MFLHNVVALAVYGGLMIAAVLIWPGPITFILAGTLFLHVLLDLIGDLHAVGHTNWLWPLHRATDPEDQCLL